MFVKLIHLPAKEYKVEKARV